MTKSDTTPPLPLRQATALFLFALATLSLLTSCGPVVDAAPDAQVWRFAIEEPSGSVQDAYAQEFKRRIEAGSGGRIEVVVYPYGTLGTSDQTTELVGMGAIDLATASPGHLGKMIPAVQALLLHFLFTPDETLNNQALNNPELLQLLSSLYSEKGFQLLSIYSEGWMVWTTKRPLTSLEDFRGLKMRVMTSPLLLAAYSAYGASPTPLPYGEVYGALQLNMIDAQVNPLFAIEEMSFYEVTDHLVFGYHAPFVTTVMANETFVRSLDPADHDLLQQTIADLVPYIDKLQRDYNTERLEIMKQKKPSLKIEELPETERQKLRAASQTTRDRYLQLAPTHGPEILQALEKAVSNARSSPKSQN